jgi:hypothetical protein
MDKAWIVFSPESLTIKGIVWKQPENNFIEVSKDIAIDFLNGNNSLLSFFVEKNAAGQYHLSKVKPVEEPSKFCSLSTLDDAGVTALVSDNGLKISLEIKQKDSLMIFCTLKSSPSWLIKSWKVSDFTPQGSYIFIPWKSAKKYSYFIGEVAF